MGNARSDKRGTPPDLNFSYTGHMIQAFFSAVFKAGLPVAIASYALVWWALKNDYLGSVASMKDLKGKVKQQAKDKESKTKTDPVHKKWLAFGGGFYGVVGFLTYAVVEIGEIRDFIVQFESIRVFISEISIDMFIALLVDALKNFIVAIAWPVYWMSDIRSDHIWIWFAVAYGGYWAGARYALQTFNNKL
jgi:hypothetical protein